MKLYLWRVKYRKYATDYVVCAFGTSVQDVLKRYAARMRGLFIDQSNIVFIERENEIDWYKKG